VTRQRKGKLGGSLRGIVRVERPQEFAGAVLVVALHDVTYADAPSHVVAERIYRVSGRRTEIPFCLPLPHAVPASAAYSLKAEIRCTDPKTLSRGDYLSTVAHPWSPGQTQAVVVVQKI